MLTVFFLSLLGVGITAAIIDSSDDDQSDSPPEAEATDPSEETDLLTLARDGGEPEAVDIETLPGQGDWQNFEGTSADETIVLTPSVVTEIHFDLGGDLSSNEGGNDSVDVGLGQSVDVFDDSEADSETDTVTITYLPSTLEQLESDGSDVMGNLEMDTADNLIVNFPPDTTGSMLSVYQEVTYYPGSTCCSDGIQHELFLVYVPEGVTVDEEFITNARFPSLSYDDFKDIGLIPFARLDLGDEGYDAGNGEIPDEEIERWDNVRLSPEFESNIPYLGQLTHIYS